MRIAYLTSQLDFRDHGQLDNALDAELLRDDHGSLLPDDECGPNRVCADISQRDRQVSNFEPTYAIHVQLRIDDAALLTGPHSARAKLIRNRKPNPKVFVEARRQ